MAQAKAHVEHQRYGWELSKHQYQHRKQLSRKQTISPEDLEAARINTELTKADYLLAQSKLEIVMIDLQRTIVKAPVDGTIVNLSLRRGNFVAQGKPVLSLVKKDSFYATGYFEETKIPLIRVGQRARVRLVSGGRELHGRVVSIARGIADTNASTNSELLPQVRPTFNWVRLAQRIPVNIALDAPPEDIVLSTGMTATITILDADATDGDR
jgi:multidrug resistance efflux pump